MDPAAIMLWLLWRSDTMRAKAVEVACDFDVFCGDGIDVLTLPGIR
jgi:hypothetical protein